MAGRGPAPAEQVRRRNRPDLDELPIAFTGKAPALPKTYRAVVQVKRKGGELVDEVKTVPYLKATKDWYAEWAAAPMAARFAATDWTRLRMVIAPLFDRYVRLPTPGLASELRLQETLLGATPMDRQRLHWALPDGATPADVERRRRPAGHGSRRARLSVVT